MSTRSGTETETSDSSEESELEVDILNSKTVFQKIDQNEKCHLSIFEPGFGSFLNSKVLSDVTLVIDGNEFNCHKIILAYNSEFFKKLFTIDMRERNQDRIELGYKDEYRVFPKVLEYLYTGDITFTPETGLPILSFSDQLLIPHLRKAAASYVRRYTTRENAIDYLQTAIKFQTHEVIDNCTHIIAKNFWLLKDPDFSWMPFPAFYSVMSDDQLGVKNEMDVYKTIKKYIDNQENLSLERIRQLMTIVRFPFMTYEQIEIIKTDKNIPHDILLEGIIARLKHFEIASPGRHKRIELESRRFIPRPPCGISFTYTGDFDGKGIIYYIGTSSNTKKRFKNPSTDSEFGIRIEASSHDRGNPLDVTDLQPVQFWTRDVPASWILFDFGENRRIVPNFYTLMHGGNYRADLLRNWDLQGSINSDDWDILISHRNDTSLDGKFATHSWPIESNNQFRYLRIIQNGYNSSHHNFLVIGGFEVYGELYEDDVGNLI